MKSIGIALGIAAVVIACSTAGSTSNSAAPKPQATAKTVASKGDTVRIANDSLEYEIIITDPGFNLFLNSVAKPRNYYGLTFLETRNIFFVMEYNRRVLEPFRYNPDLYVMRIDYDRNIRYGYEVNYLLYNYFLFFQREYRQKL